MGEATTHRITYVGHATVLIEAGGVHILTDPVLRQRVKDECLSAYLHDTRDAWLLQPGGDYQRAEAATGRAPQVSAQAALMALYSARSQA